MSNPKCADYYAMTMQELDLEEGRLEGKLADLRDARRELINRTGSNKSAVLTRNHDAASINSFPLSHRQSETVSDDVNLHD